MHIGARKLLVIWQSVVHATHWHHGIYIERHKLWIDYSVARFRECWKLKQESVALGCTDMAWDSKFNGEKEMQS
ncbi:hypothetical protein NC652_015269 [Populus alba x Populus x berolinensis]|nr:hypothetical protein NC652_015269 [Populus alba x Populus x berolinensis]